MNFRLPTKFNRWPGLLMLICTVFAMSACSSTDTTRSGLFESYRTDLPQGNYVTNDMLKRIKVGMSKLQVRRAMGSPLLTDVFSPQKWNYIFSYRHPNGRVDLRKVVVQFDATDTVSKIDADELPEKETPEDPALPGFNPDNLKLRS